MARTGGGKIEQKTTCPTLYIIVTGRHLFIMEQCVPDPHTFCDAVSHPGYSGALLPKSLFCNCNV